jgi:hypothetical protein
MNGIKTINPNADVIDRKKALIMNAQAAKGLQDILKTNLGPKGTMKMLVSGAGDVQLTKDGKVLLDQMQISHPTACIIARTATAQDDITGDGTTSNVLLTGELMKQAERWLVEGVHPRVLVEGFELAREKTLEFLHTFKQPLTEEECTRELLVEVARTSIRTKCHRRLISCTLYRLSVALSLSSNKTMPFSRSHTRTHAHTYPHILHLTRHSSRHSPIQLSSPTTSSRLSSTPSSRSASRERRSICTWSRSVRSALFFVCVCVRLLFVVVCLFISHTRHLTHHSYSAHASPQRDGHPFRERPGPGPRRASPRYG